jgi:hypothetical protein
MKCVAQVAGKKIRGTHRGEEAKGQQGRPSSRWLDNITIDVTERVWSDKDWIDLGKDKDHWSGFL